MKILALLLSCLFVIACAPPLGGQTSFEGQNGVSIKKIAEIPEHGCDVYLIARDSGFHAGFQSHTITVCPNLRANASTGVVVRSGKTTKVIPSQTVEAPSCQ